VLKNNMTCLSSENIVKISKKPGHNQTPLIINFGRDNLTYILKEDKDE